MTYTNSWLMKQKKADLIELVEQLQSQLKELEPAQDALYLTEELRLARERNSLGVANHDEIRELEHQLEMVG